MNGDGTIDYEEFLAATIHASKLEAEENLYRAFQYFDKDSSGFISREELVEALSQGSGQELAGEIDTIIAQVGGE